MMYAEFDYQCPQNLLELFRLQQQWGPDARLYAGGTDLLIQLRAKKTAPKVLIDIKKIPEFQGIKEEEEALFIGAACTFDQIASHPYIIKNIPALASAASQIGSVQIGQKATLAGNIQNASPAGDGFIATYGLGGMVELISSDSHRRVPLCDFVKGPGQTDLAPGETISQIVLPKRKWSYQSFIKLGRRNALAISVLNGLIALETDSTQTIQKSRIVLGAVAPVPLRITQAEQLMLGKRVSEIPLDQLSEVVRQSVSPISDIRASAEYRRYVAGATVVSEIEKAAEGLS